jgi:MFS family permease
MMKNDGADVSHVDRAGDFRRLGVLIAVACVDLLGAAMVFPLIPFYALKLKVPPVAIGAILSSFFVAQLIAAPMWGRISDRYGRRPALLIGLGSLAAGYLIFGLANSIWMLLLSRVVQGAGGGTTAVTQAYVTDTVRPEDRARALGWLSTGTNVGTSLGGALGSFTVRWGQFAPGGIAALLCGINLICAWMWLPESRKSGATPVVRKPVWHGVWQVLRHPGGTVQRLTLIYALGMFGFSCLSSVMALYLGARFGVTERTIGYVFVYQGVFNILMRSALIGPIVDRIGEAWSMRLGVISVVLGLIGYPLAWNYFTLALVIPLLPIGTALLFPATTALMSRASPRSDVGTTLGIAQTFAGISRLIAPTSATALFQYLGHGMPFVFAAEMVALAGLLVLQLDVRPAPVARNSAVHADA